MILGGEIHLQETLVQSHGLRSRGRGFDTPQLQEKRPQVRGFAWGLNSVRLHLVHMDIVCNWCGDTIDKRTAEINRQLRKGNEKFFCSRSHAISYSNRERRKKNVDLEISREDLLWLSGLLEGEGSFMAGPPSSPSSPRVSVQMTDEDIVERISTLLGTSYRQTKRRVAHHKQSFMITLSGRRAVALMRSLYDLMGKRRKEQIYRAINSCS